MKTFKEITTTNSNTLMIVDALNMCFSFRGKKKYKDNYVNMIESLARSYKAGKIIVAADKGASSYRKNILPEYKQNRQATREKQTESERLEFIEFFTEFNEALTILKSSEYKDILKVFQFDGVEADDILAYISSKYKKHYDIWLISSDKDIDLLVDDNVSRFSYVTRKETRIDNWNDHYDYDLDKHISIKCLTGDSGDNIPGVDGIGPARAKALVEQYGDTYDIISSMPIPSKYKYIAALNEFGKDNLLRNYRLMDLVSYCDEALGEANCKEIDRVLGEYLC
jgi:5'-3' exonuclease